MTFDTFAAANTRRGFFSLFEGMIRRHEGRIFLIKGGPGTGKSSFMKAVADAAQAKGYTVERIHCSSDPASLDGVRIEQKGVLILDATAPHCADPEYPGVREHLLPFGEFWDAGKLAPHRKEILSLTRGISGEFSVIYRYLAAAGEIRQSVTDLLAPAFDREKAVRAVRRILRQSAVLPSGGGKVTARFVSAFGRDGTEQFDKTLAADRIVLLNDAFDAAHLWTQTVRDEIEAAGQNAVLFLDPLDPERVDHILLPDASLAFVTRSYRLPFAAENAEKVVALRAFLDRETPARHKNKLRFAKKMLRALYREVSQSLAREKDLHDALESFYIRAMDFDRLSAFTEDFIQREI